MSFNDAAAAADVVGETDETKDGEYRRCCCCGGDHRLVVVVVVHARAFFDVSSASR
jgi:hypothetical protein